MFPYALDGDPIAADGQAAGSLVGSFMTPTGAEPVTLPDT